MTRRRISSATMPRKTINNYYSTSATNKFKYLLFCPYTLILIILTINLSNCQTNPRHVAAPRQAPEPADDAEPAVASSSATPGTRCNHQVNQDELREQQVPIYLNQHQQFRNNGGRQQRPSNLHQQQQQQQQHHTGRQQRQFTSNHLPPRSAAMIAAPEGQPPPPPPPAPSAQPEEFSLSSIANPMNQAPVAGGGAQPADAPSAAPSDSPLNGTSYVMLDSSASGTTTTTATTTTAASPTTTTTTTTTIATSAHSPPVGSTSTTTEQATPLNTTPALAPDSIGSPVVPQPPATTSSSILQPVATSASMNGNKSPTSYPVGSSIESTQQRQQAGRRIEDSSSSLMSDNRHASNLSAGDDQPPAESHPSAKSSSSSAISSSPSSVSIITPLIGPPTQHQHQQAAVQSASSSSSSSSMIKPIYVVGNPLAELDYTSTTYSSSSGSGNQQQASRLGAATSVRPVQRTEKRVDEQQQPQLLSDGASANATSAYAAAAQDASVADGERMNGPALVYSDGHLVANAHHMQHLNATLQSHQQQPNETPSHQTQNSAAIPPPPSPRLFQGPMPSVAGGAAVLGNTPRRPSLPPPVNQANAASGFRSPMSPSGPLVGQPALSAASANQQQQQQQQQQQPALQAPVNQNLPNFYQTSPPYAGAGGQLFSSGPPTSTSLMPSSPPGSLSNKQAFVLASQKQQQQLAAGGMPTQFQLQMQQAREPQASITNQQAASTQVALGGGGGGPSRRPLNITRVEHISAECSNDLIRAIIVFNGTFKGIIYSSGYVNDPTCLYVNGTGLTRYEFSIRLNQCGTLGRQELHQPTIPGEARRRDQVMWNTLSIQYNPVIEQEWDEHFRVSCEYGSDFWKTISFSPFNVETNTGAPVVFTINPPQCQMDVLLGHGMGPKIAVDGPVTVGDPLTLLIHMKSEKAGYDILVKNCVAHNGGKQRMQLIDSNGCVVNERFISPFRGTYNDNDLRHVTLYAYLKAFRFTGSPVLYLECEIHMCQSACPPQMCYWRRLSKRSVDNNDFEYTDDRASLGNLTNGGDNSDEFANLTQPIISDSLSLFKALQVRHEPLEPAKARRRAQQLQEIYAEDDESQLVCYRHAEVLVFMTTIGSLLLLVLTVAITCCLRIRKLTRNQFKHNKLDQQRGQSSSASSSLISQSLSSPSLLSISDALSQVASYAEHQQQQQQHSHCPSNHGLVSPTGSYCGAPINYKQSEQQPPPRPAAKPSSQQVAAAFCLQKPRLQTTHRLSPHNHSRQFNLGSPTSTADIYTR